ncbi:MAG: hydrogenase iron-sulfur subunit [Bryobacteraceae bacterium]|nr:hydrogenase iron-sulfur subunit [Bryobacteraceae bacterium]
MERRREDRQDGGSGWEPRIIGFLCQWCSYTGADNAGTARIQYPPNVDVIKVMCSGRVDPELVLAALARGADGVLVLGCHPGDCHYISGNHKTMVRMPLVRSVLRDFGIEEGRFRHDWVSAAEGEKFARVVAEMTEEVRRLGPLRWPQRLEESGFRTCAAPAPCGEAVR